MNLEELKQIIFLSEHGYYDEKAVKLANKNKPKSIERYEIVNGEIYTMYREPVIITKNIHSYYPLHSVSSGKELLNIFRKDWIKANFPKIKKLTELGEEK